MAIGPLIAIKKYFERKDELTGDSDFIGGVGSSIPRKIPMKELTEFKAACTPEELRELGQQACDLLGEELKG